MAEMMTPAVMEAKIAEANPPDYDPAIGDRCNVWFRSTGLQCHLTSTVMMVGTCVHEHVKRAAICDRHAGTIPLHDFVCLTCEAAGCAECVVDVKLEDWTR